MMASRKKRSIYVGRVFAYLFLIVFGFVMIYPLIWMLSASFKTNVEIFASKSLIPSSFSLQAYFDGWKGSGQVGYSTFYKNSFLILIPSLLMVLVSSITIAYGFARFNFWGKPFFFNLMIATLMLPSSVITIPRYLLFQRFGWINTFRPLVVPSMFGTAFFIFMMVQFMRGIPRDLDEAAYIDGSGSLNTLIKIIVPLCKPAIFSVVVFHSLWTWNDFFGPLIFLNSPAKYTVALGLRQDIDPGGNVNWANVMAMSLLSVIPIITLYFSAQKYFVEGIATTGMKG